MTRQAASFPSTNYPNGSPIRLIEPLQAAGIAVTDIDALTGLPEYRNGGLFVDLDVLVPNDPTALAQTHSVD